MDLKNSKVQTLSMNKKDIEVMLGEVSGMTDSEKEQFDKLLESSAKYEIFRKTGELNRWDGRKIVVGREGVEVYRTDCLMIEPFVTLPDGRLAEKNVLEGIYVKIPRRAASYLIFRKMD